ncbi:MAG: TolC family protein [bacterium]|nr:TolC family protein [bacterium]
MRILTLVLTTFLLFLPLAAEITMEQAVEKAVEKNLACKNSRLESKALALDKKNAEMQKRFTIDSAASYLFRSQRMEISFPDSNPAPGIVIPGFTKPAGTKHNFDLNVGVRQPLFTGHILSNNIKRKTSQLTAEKYNFLLDKIETAAAVKTSYYNYRLLNNRLETLNTLIKQLDLHYGKLKDLFEQEMVKKSDLLETEAKIQEQYINRQDLEHAIEKERINFANLCDTDVREMEKHYVEKAKDYAGSFSDFKLHHPALKTLAEKMSELGIKEDIIKGAYLPQVGSFAELHAGKPGIDFFKNKWSVYFQGGISVNFKVFDWHKKKRDVGKLHYRVEKIKNRRQDFISMGEKNLKQLYDAGRTAREKLKTVAALVGIANEDIRLKEELVREQQISNIDYLSALTKKEQYESMQNTLQAQMAIINVNINTLSVGGYQEEVQ